jgi:molecular chaperone DnaJ
MRLRGKGLPDVNGRGRGDIIIVVDVVIPTELTKEERKLVEQLSEQPNFKQTESKQDQDILSRMKNFFR